MTHAVDKVISTQRSRKSHGVVPGISEEKGLRRAVRLGAPSMGVVYSGSWGGTISVQVNASELASRSGTREKECDLQVLSELGISYSFQCLLLLWKIGSRT